MHELSIAISVIDVASEEAERLNARVIAVHLRLGPLSGVVKEALLWAYELAREGSLLADSRLVITEVPIIAWCATCQADQTIPSVQQMSCPVCESPTPEVRSGNELEVSGLEIASESIEA